MSKALTDMSVAKAKPDPAKRLEIPDGLVTGLYLVVQPSGKRGFAVRYRAYGKPRKLTLGAYPQLTLSAAREGAKAILLEVAEGKDPAATKREVKAATGSDANRFEAAVRRYLTEYQKPKNRSWREAARQLGLAPDKAAIAEASTDREAKAIADDPQRFAVVKGGLVDRWGHRPLDSITTDDILAELNDQARVMANRVLVTFNTMWRFFLNPKHRLATKNPVTGIERPAAEASRDRVLSDEELRAVWKASDVLGYPWGPLVQMLILTGQRRDEVARLPWSEIDGKTWVIAPERSKNGKSHTVHLSPAAMEILASLPRMGAYAFTSNGTTPVAGYTKAKERLNELAGVGAGWWFHDLRRTMATKLGEIGVPLEVTETVLNHTSGSRGGLAGVYQRSEYEPQKYRALHAWGRYVTFIIDDEHYARWTQRLHDAENRFDLQLAFGDAVLAGGSAWEQFVGDLSQTTEAA